MMARGVVGARAATESVIAVFVAFRRQRVWVQARLAEQLGVSVKSLKRCLVNMSLAGVPLTHEEDDIAGRKQILWTMTPAWYPDGILLCPNIFQELVELVKHAPQSPQREDLLQSLFKYSSSLVEHEGWCPGEFSRRDEEHLRLLEKAWATTRELKLRYASSRSGVRERLVTVCHVSTGIPVRFLALDHESAEYRWFRLDAVVEAMLSSTEGREVDSLEVERIVSESVDGFHDGAEAREHRFLVRYPEASWVRHNLLESMVPKTTDKGVIISAKVAGANNIARFVVGLGEAATPLTEELRKEVRRLAEGALKGLDNPLDGTESG